MPRFVLRTRTLAERDPAPVSVTQTSTSKTGNVPRAAPTNTLSAKAGTTDHAVLLVPLQGTLLAVGQAAPVLPISTLSPSMVSVSHVVRASVPPAASVRVLAVQQLDVPVTSTSTVEGHALRADGMQLAQVEIERLALAAQIMQWTVAATTGAQVGTSTVIIVLQGITIVREP